MNYLELALSWVTAIGNVFTSLDSRDVISLIGITAALVTFGLKLNADSKAARYRETVGFIDRNSSRLSDNWKAAQRHLRYQSTNAGFDDNIKEMLNLLDTTALLITKKAFDEELIYNYWWKYFTEPMENQVVRDWVAARQTMDKAVLEHYTDLQGRWSARVKKEKGR